MKPQKTVLLALSGGVDSSIAALLLKKQGYRVIAAFMKNFSDIKDKLTGECNWIEEYKMAQKIAAILKIPLIKLDFEKQYKKYVIEPMFKAYRRGLTPNPDITCNKIIKFPLLWKHALKLKADYIATGHYARIEKTKNDYELLAGKDKAKDQSYFLSELSKSDLSHTLFPIGNYTKSQIRKIAKKYRLPNWNKKGTSGICFVGNIPMKSFLEQKIRQKKGNVIDDRENIIGYHGGAEFYTVGEKTRESSGIHINKGSLSQKRFYVANKNVKDNTITAVPKNHSLLLKNQFRIKNMHFINPKDKKNKVNCRVRIRHLGQLIPCTLSNNRVSLKKPISGIAEGQYAVFYVKDKVLASGEIRFN